MAFLQAYPEPSKAISLSAKFGARLSLELEALPTCPYSRQLDAVPAPEIGGDLLAWIWAKKVQEGLPFLRIANDLEKLFASGSAQATAFRQMYDSVKQGGRMLSEEPGQQMDWQKLPQFADLASYLLAVDKSDIAQDLSRILLSFVPWSAEYETIHAEFKQEIRGNQLHRRAIEGFDFW